MESCFLDLRSYRKIFSKPEPCFETVSIKRKDKRKNRNDIFGSDKCNFWPPKKSQHKKSKKSKKKEKESNHTSQSYNFEEDIPQDDSQKLSDHDRITILVHQRHACLKLMMPSTTSVDDLKLQLQSLTQIAPHKQRLFFKCTQLLGNQILNELKQDVVCLAMVVGSLQGGGKELPSVEQVVNWFTRSYQSSPGETVSKESVYLSACNYFDKYANKEGLYRFLFETLGRHVFSVHEDFKMIKMKRGRKSIQGLSTRYQDEQQSEVVSCNVQQTSTEKQDEKQSEVVSCNVQQTSTEKQDGKQSEVVSCNAQQTSTEKQDEKQSEVVSCNAQQTSTEKQDEKQSEVVSCNAQQTSTEKQGEEQSEVVSCNAQQTSTEKQGEKQSEVVSCNVQQTSTEKQGEKQSEVVSCNAQQTSTEKQGEKQSEVVSCNVQQTSIEKQDEEQSEVVSCNAQQTSTEKQGEKQSEVVSCNVQQTSTEKQGEEQSEVVSCNAQQTSTEKQGEKQSEVVSCNVQQTSTEKQGEKQSEVVSCNAQQTSTEKQGEEQSEVVSCNAQQTSTEKQGEKQSEVVSCNVQQTSTEKQDEKQSEVVSCNVQQTSTEKQGEGQSEVVSCNVQQTSTEKQDEKQSEVVSCNAQQTSTEKQGEEQSEVVSCNAQQTSTKKQDENQSEVVSCNVQQTSIEKQDENQSEVVSCNAQQTSTEKQGEEQSEVVSCNAQQTSTKKQDEKQSEVVSCNVQQTSFEKQDEKQSEVVSCNAQQTSTEKQGEEQSEVVSCNAQQTSTKKQDENQSEVVSCNVQQTSIEKQDENQSEVVSCNVQQTSFEKQDEKQSEVVSCNAQQTSTEKQGEEQSEVVSCNAQQTSTKKQDENQSEVVSCNVQQTSIEKQDENQSEVVSCNAQQTSTEKQGEEQSEVVSCNAQQTSTKKQDEKQSEVVSCNVQQTSFEKQDEKQSEVVSCNAQQTSTEKQGEEQSEVVSCNAQQTSTKKQDENQSEVVSCNVQQTSIEKQDENQSEVVSCNAQQTSTEKQGEEQSEVVSCNAQQTSTKKQDEKQSEVVSCNVQQTSIEKQDENQSEVVSCNAQQTSTEKQGEEWCDIGGVTLTEGEKGNHVIQEYSQDNGGQSKDFCNLEFLGQEENMEWLNDDQGWNEELVLEKEDEDTSCVYLEEIEGFCRKSILQRNWSNSQIKELKPKDLSCTSFENLLELCLPYPLAMINNKRRSRIYQESSKCDNKMNNMFRAFLCYTFPPIEISRNVEKEFKGITYGCDKFPQFTCVSHQSVRNKSRVSICCEICTLYEESCLRRGLFAKIGRSPEKTFDGISQVIAHHQSRNHQAAAAYLSGLKPGKDYEDTATLNKPSSCQPKQRTIMEALKITRSDTPVSECLHFFENPDIVDSFKDDCDIRKVSTKTLFERERSKGRFQCFTREASHIGCSSFKGWKEKHPDEAEELGKSRPARAVYVLINKEVTYRGQKIYVKGAIKSLDPPCTGKRSGLPSHPLTCQNCFKQQQYLVDLHKKRGQSVYDPKDVNRIGMKGFRHDYAQKTEMREKVGELQQTNVNLGKSLTRMSLKHSKTWEEILHDSCRQKYQEKLIVDLLHLFKQDVDQTNPVQLAVIRNLVGKLKGNVNHHYMPLMKTIGKLHKIRLGETNYDLLKDLFGLPCSTTCDNFRPHKNLQPGYNKDFIDHAVKLYEGGPVIDASDEARALRYLQAIQSDKGEVILVGKSFSPDIEKWHEEFLYIPRRKESEGDKDDFSALQRTVKNIIDDNSLASKVSIHNFSSLGCASHYPLIYMMWPTPSKGYTGRHLLKIWEKVREDCAKAVCPLKLVGHSADSAGFSLSAQVTLMTPTESTVANGIFYLGLGIPDEKFIAPYFWKLPSIAYSDYDHLRRTLLRNLKYQTYELTMFKDETGALIATINHLHELMEICTTKGEIVPFSAQDLILINFFDQRPDTANRIFNLRVAEMLESHVKGSEATCLYIIAVNQLTQPFYQADFGTPGEIQRSISTGITIFRLWRRYLELKKVRLHALPHAAKVKEKRGHFLTYGAYTSAELIFSAASLHALAMFLHFKDFGPSLCSPHRSGTISTEKIIGQLQGKTNSIQTLDTSPTFGDMLNRSKDLQFTTEALTDLSTYEGVKVPATSNRKKSHFEKQSTGTSLNYQYPDSYQEFLKSQQREHREGVKQAQELVQKFLPFEFRQLLESNDAWECPFTFQKPKNLKMIKESPPPLDYCKLSVSLAESSDSEAIMNSVNCANEVEMEDLVIESEEPSIRIATGNTSDSDSDGEEEESDSDEGETTSETIPSNMKWYVKKGESNVHISRALKVLLPREYISKERSRRHWVGKSLIQAWNGIDKSHDVIRFRDVAIKEKGKVVLLHVLSIQSSDGKDLISTSSKAKGSVRGRPYVEISESRYDVPRRPMVSKWIPLSKVLCEIVMSTDSDGTLLLSEESKARLQSKEKDIESKISGEDDDTSEEFYEVEKVLEVRINKDFHTEEYKVRFKGYTSDDDMWLPSSAFKEPVSFETVSKRGRVRRHTMKEEAMSVNMQKRKRSPSKDVPGGSKSGEMQKSKIHKVDSSKEQKKDKQDRVVKNGKRKRVNKGKQQLQKRRKTNGRDFRKSAVKIAERGTSESVSSEDEAVERQLVCRASFHQGEMIPFQFHYPGQQCGGIAMTALLYSTVRPVDSWRGADLDEVLAVGDRLHFFQVCSLRLKVGGTQKLAVDELPTDVTMFDYKFEVETNIVAGSTIKETRKNGLVVLEGVLEDCVNNNHHGIVLRYQDFCVAFINSYGEWYLFDSHARDAQGLVDGNGKAVLLKFANSIAAASHINQIQMDRAKDSSFEALVIRKINRKATSTNDEMSVCIYPIVVLVRYTSRYGNVELYNDSLQNLEHGYLIDDNLMDLALFYHAEIKSANSGIPADSIHIFSACFYQKLTNFNPNKIRSWTKHVNIFNKKFTVIPVCIGSHWILVLIKMNHGAGVSMMILDSSSTPDNVTRRSSVERVIKSYLKDEWKAKTKNNNISFQNVIYAEVPQQPNATDCGVYVMMFFKEFLNNLPLDQWPNWAPRFSHDAVMQLRSDTMFLIQELASQ